MSLPTIAPYEMPSAPTPSPVTWTPDPTRSVLLVHDMQEYFLAAFRRDAEPVPTLLANIAGLVDHARALEVPVVYTCQPGDQHPLRRGLLTDRWGPGMPTGVDTEVVAELAPRPQDHILTKWRYSAFERTDLRALLSHAGRDQLIVTGVYAHLGCQVTAVDAFMADVQPFMVSDAVADFSTEEHQQALHWVATGCGRVLDTVAVRDLLSHHHQPLNSVAEVRTDRGERYVRQMTSHLSHKATVVDGGAVHTLHFPPERQVAAMGRMGVVPGGVRLSVAAADPDSLGRAQHVLGVHLERFGSREGLQVRWG